MHYVVPCDPSLTIRQNSSVTGENSSINQDCSDRSVLKKECICSDVCSAILYCSTKETQTLIRASRLPSISPSISFHYWRHFLDMVNILQICSALGCQEFTVGFEPSRNGEIFYTSLPEINVIYFLLIKWAYSSWQKHKCVVLSRYHIFNRTVNSKSYVCFFKMLYHLLFKVSRATNKDQNVWNVWTKVSGETCSSGLLSSGAGKVT